MPWSVTQRLILTRSPRSCPRGRPPCPAAAPNPDAVFAPFAGHVQGRQRADDPFLQGGDEAADVGAPAPEIEHDIGHPLAGSMIGELSAPAGRIDGKAGLDQLPRFGAGAGGIERRCSSSQTSSGAEPAAMAVARASMSASAAS